MTSQPLVPEFPDLPLWAARAIADYDARIGTDALPLDATGHAAIPPAATHWIGDHLKARIPAFYADPTGWAAALWETHLDR